MDIEIVAPKDLEAVKCLIEEVAQQDVLPHFTRQGRDEFQSRVLKDVKTAFDLDLFYSIKAIDNNRLVGFAALREGNYLTHLFVAKSAQKTGLGALLLDELLRSTQEKRISLRSSVNAEGFYQRYGFAQTGEESEFNGIRFVPMTLTR
tara:strand:+ start:740 stop:1183 length:444 start_codon:yes stop_codon:yes gene_type:complete